MAKVTFDDELDATMRELEADKNSMFMNLKHYHRDENLEIKMLRREQIYPNPINEPYMQDVTEEQIRFLYDNIKQNGLMHNLVVLDDLKGRYRLISGEKRWTAIQKMSKEEYEDKFPNGIACKVIRPDIEFTNDDEWRILLECNVLVASAKPDKKQMQDLIALYDRMGSGKDEIVNYLKYQIGLSKLTIERTYGVATAIPELRELEEKGIVNTTAMRVLCQGDKKNGLEEIQRECCRMIKEEYEGQVTNEPLAAEIKKACTGIVKGRETESKTCRAVRAEISKKITKGLNIIINYKDKDIAAMKELEKTVCIKELEDAQRKIGEAIKKFQTGTETKEK